MKSLIGKRVKIIGGHPWAGENGTGKEMKKLSFGNIGLVVSLDNGCECFVFKPSHIKLLNE